jgi:hypothetical protein
MMKATKDDSKSGQAEMRSAIGAIEEKMDAWRANMKDDREETTACREAMEGSIKKMEPNSGEKEAVVEQQKIPNEEVSVHSLRACRSEAAGSQEATEANTEKTEPDRGIMQSAVEHQIVPKEEAVVKPVEGRKKRRRGRKLPAGRRGEPKELTRSDCGSGKKLAAACREVTSCARVAWRKRNLFKKIGTQGNCGTRKEFAAAGIRMINCAGVTWLRRRVVRKYCTRAKVERATQRVGPFRKDLRMHHEGKCGTKDLGGKRPP